MSRFTGASSVEVAAPVLACFELVCDTPRTPEWHQAIADVEILERDAEGRTSLVAARIDALVAKVEVNLRLSYDPPRIVHMSRESGELRELTVTWTFEELACARTMAGFHTEFDPGRLLSVLAWGPVIARLTTLLAEQPTAGLKQAVERS